MIPSANCPYCGEYTYFIFIRSHYSCPRCFRPVLDCCDGQNQTHMFSPSTKLGEQKTPVIKPDLSGKISSTK